MENKITIGVEGVTFEGNVVNMVTGAVCVAFGVIITGATAYCVTNWKEASGHINNFISVKIDKIKSSKPEQKIIPSGSEEKMRI